ncbi:MAG: phosphoenolpyruvate--protein phosphotransferase [Phycisphaerae bacterium]|nr:phosphoenolpyruvate--protein phosphotransferase [Phycisphaerae bacterium]
MEVLKGIAVSPGIAIGEVFVVDDERRRIPRRTVPAAQVAAEKARAEQAVRDSVSELAALRDRTAGELGEEAAKIFAFHLGMLADRSLTGPLLAQIEREGVTAEFAVWTAMELLASRFAAMPDAAFRTKVDDVRDLSGRVLRHLIGEHASRLHTLRHRAVVVARDLTPSQAAAFDRGHVIGFVTEMGGRTSHTAIFARALGIPAVVGCAGVSAHVTDGAAIVIDGDEGTVVVDPTEEQLAAYQVRIERARLLRLSLAELATLPSVTRDGHRIELMGNIELPDEIPAVLEHGGEGVGLFRTEFLYLTSDHEPTEEEQYQAYASCVRQLAGRPLTVRTLDLGADKYTQAQQEEPERNPFLGCRSIRYCLQSLPMFKRQLRAILRASAQGPLKVMFPLITSTTEFRQARFILNDVMDDLEDEGIKFDRNVQVGMMVEVPSAAIMADAFAREADFFSIGTNDLVQYTLAVDRTNERVASLYNPGHPAVIRLIREVVRAAGRHDIPLSVCGEAAGETEHALLLIGLGVRTLSATSSSIPRLKRLVRSVELSQCERLAKKAAQLDSEVAVTGFLRDGARKIIPEAFDGRSADE